MQIRQIINELRSETLHTLSLKDIVKGAAFDRATFVEFCDAFAVNASLISLDFTGFELADNIDGLVPFFTALKQNRGLKQLHFSGIKSVAKYMAELSDALSEPDGNTTLLTLDLSHCGITDKQIENLTFLKNNHTLQSLNLENNHLSASGAASIARQLKHYKRKSDLYSAKEVAKIKDFPLFSEEPAKNEKLHELKLGQIAERQDSSYDAATIKAGIQAALEQNKRKLFQASDSGLTKIPDEKMEDEKTGKAQPDFRLEENIGILLMLQEPTEATIKSISTLPNIAYIFVRDKDQNIGLFYINKELEECSKIKISQEKLDSLYLKMNPPNQARTLTSDEARELSSLLNPKVGESPASPAPLTERKEGTIAHHRREKERQQPEELKLTFLNNHKSAFKPVYSTEKPKKASLFSSHIKKVMLKFTGSTTALGLFAIAILLAMGCVASGPVGWIMAGTIIGGCLAAGLIIGAITGAITVPKASVEQPKPRTLPVAHHRSTAPKKISSLSTPEKDFYYPQTSLLFFSEEQSRVRGQDTLRMPSEPSANSLSK